MYSIRLAKVEELAQLPAIAAAATELFMQFASTAQLPSYLTPLDKFEEAQRQGLLWVAATEQDEPIGFALLELMGDAAHLEEIDLLPAYSRRGIGTALVRAVCDWAAAQSLPVTLATFRDIPWSAPFYAQLGFRELQEEELTTVLRTRVVEEAAHGLPASLRVAMRYRRS